MRKSRFSEGQIVTVLKRTDVVVPVEELCRRPGVGRRIFCRWKTKYRGSDRNKTRWRKASEEENRRLTKMHSLAGVTCPAVI
jgi:putative transposase